MNLEEYEALEAAELLRNERDALAADRDQISLALAVAKADRDKWFNRARELEAALRHIGYAASEYARDRCVLHFELLCEAETAVRKLMSSQAETPAKPPKVVRTGIATPTHPGSYTSICLSCDRHMDWADKRCRLCTDCSTSDRGSK